MTKLLITAAAVAAILVAVACTADTDTPETPDVEQTTSRCDPEIDSALAAWADAGFSGSVAIAAGGEPICQAGYGLADEAADTPNTPDTVFSIGSITKAFTAAAIFDLVDDGVLAPDDRVGDLLPELRGPVADATLLQLMVHTSGLSGTFGGDDEPLERDAAVAAIDALEPAFEPGADHLYSNAGYTLLALVVEEASGTTYREHAMERVLAGHPTAGFWNGEPAAPGPRAVGYLDDGSTGESGDFAGPHWALDGNGGLAMTMPELAAWTRALFTGQVVSPESAEVIASPQIDQGEGRWETPGWVAFDESVYGQPLLATAGGGGDVGHNAVAVWVPEGEQVIAVASNGPGVSAEELLAVVVPALAAGDPLPAPDIPGSGSDQGDAAAIVGSYELDTGGSYEVTTGDDGLRISAHGADAVEALFAPRDADAVAAHEDLVTALLAGETAEGRDELADLESFIDPITDVTLAGSIVDGGELRTYVTFTTSSGEVTGWYALDDEGGIMGALVETDPPALTLVPDGDGYRPDDPTGSGPEVTVTFADGELTIDGPGGTTSAHRAS